MFWRGIVVYLPVNIVQVLAGFGAIVLFTRLLSPVQFGDYAIGFAVSNLAQTCLFGWIEAAMGRFYMADQEPQARQTLFATLYSAFFNTSLVVALIAAAIALTPWSMAIKTALWSALAACIVRSLLRMAQERRRAAGEAVSFAAYDVAQTGGGFGLGVLFAQHGLGGAAPLAGTTLACLLCLVVALPPDIERALEGKVSLPKLKAYARYGAPVALSLMFSLAISNTDRLVLAAFRGEGAVGAYHAGYTLANRTLDVMFVWLGTASWPAAVAALEHGGRQALDRVARTQINLMVLVGLPACAGLALIAHPLAGLMVGPQLAVQAAEVTVWIAFSAFFAGLTTYYFNTAFTLHRKTGRLIWAIGLPAGFNILATLLLVPRFGLAGAMWAACASYGLGALISVHLAKPTLSLPVPWKTSARTLFATAGMAVAVVVTPVHGGAPEIIAKALIGLLVFSALAWVVNAGDCRDLWRTFRSGPAGQAS